MIHDSPDSLVGVLDHLRGVFEILLQAVLGLGPFVAIWGRHKRPMRQSHGVVNKERLLLIPGDEVRDKIGPHVGAILPIPI